MDKNEKKQALIKEIQSLDLETISKSLDLIIKANGKIIQSIYDSKPELGLGEVYIETLLIKILITSKSILRLSQGIEFSILDHPEKYDIIDRTSLYILTRSIIEAFLTLEYLFINNLEREEQIFRYNLWRISGFQSRQNFADSLDEKIIKQIETEKNKINKLKVEITKSKYYSKLNKNELWKLDNYGFPRILSWSKLLDNSILKNNIFSKVYSLYSNYAHSEFISIIQLNESQLSKVDQFNEETVKTTLFNVRLINCVSLIILKDKFSFAGDSFEKLDENLKSSIEFWNKFATN